VIAAVAAVVHNGDAMILLPLALVSLLAPVAATEAAPAELAPAPTPAPAPAPAVTVETAPASTVTVEASPATTVTVEAAPAPVIVVQPSEPAPAPIVIVTPSPAPFTLSPPAPTWGPVPPPSYIPPTPERTRATMRAHRRAAVGVLAIGAAGMGATLGFQSMRVRGLQRCAAQPSTDSRACTDYEAMDVAFGYYGGLGMGMFVAASAGAGAMLGNAAATRDVQLLDGVTRPRGGLKLLGIVAIGASAAWMLGANWRLLQHEAQCDGDPQCLLRYRPLRLAANDGAALGVAAGAGMLGYAIAYERQGKALMRLRAAPSIGRRSTGVAVSMQF
jgi:hypothetical protein